MAVIDVAAYFFSFFLKQKKFHILFVVLSKTLTAKEFIIGSVDSFPLSLSSEERGLSFKCWSQCHIDYANSLCECLRHTLLTFLFQQLRKQTWTADCSYFNKLYSTKTSIFFYLILISGASIIVIFIPQSWSGISFLGIFFLLFLCVCEVYSQ